MAWWEWVIAGVAVAVGSLYITGYVLMERDGKHRFMPEFKARKKQH